MDYSQSDILDLVESRYSNQTTPISLSTADFDPSFNGGLELTVDRVAISLLEVIGSGGGDNNCTTTAAAATTMATTTVGAETVRFITDGAERLRVSVATVTLLAAVATTVLQVEAGQ